MKKTYLLDTNIVSEFAKENPNKQVIDFYEARRDMCAISAVTWQELKRGVCRLSEGRKKKYLECCLESYEECFDVIPYDKFSASICGEIQARAEKDGKPLPNYDSQIAATAIANGMVLVTHNTADFERMKENAFLRVEDWFTAQPNYFIGNKDIRGCIACGRCGQLGKCVFDDAVNEFAPKFKDADGLVVGSSVYYSAPNATIQAFFTETFLQCLF